MALSVSQVQVPVAVDAKKGASGREESVYRTTAPSKEHAGSLRHFEQHSRSSRCRRPEALEAQTPCSSTSPEFRMQMFSKTWSDDSCKEGFRGCLVVCCAPYVARSAQGQEIATTQAECLCRCWSKVGEAGECRSHCSSPPLSLAQIPEAVNNTFPKSVLRGV